MPFHLFADLYQVVTKSVNRFLIRFVLLYRNYGKKIRRNSSTDT